MMGKQNGQIQMVEIFNEIVLQCVQLGIVSGKTGVADGSFLPSNVSWDSRYEAVETISLWNSRRTGNG